jgi:glycosyltransferase involved in cell wall biosynthesis
MTGGRPAPRVVALVPTWRAAAFIAETLGHLSAQTHPNLEILISDDASPDGTADLCERHAARDPRVRVIRQPRNLGWVGNVNALLREARGDYFLFAFQDDHPEPDYVRRCVAALESNPGAIMAFSDIVLVHQDGTREEKRYAVLDGVTDRLQRGRRVAAQQGSWWIPNRGVFRAEAARAIGGLRRNRAGEFSADWPWLLHMSLLGEFVRTPDLLCTKIYQPRSLSRSWRFDLGSWTAVTLSAMAAVSRAKIPVGEKLVLHGTLAAFHGRHLRRAARHLAGDTLRKLGLRRSARAPGTRTGDAGRSEG